MKSQNEDLRSHSVRGVSDMLQLVGVAQFKTPDLYNTDKLKHIGHITDSLLIKEACRHSL